MFYRPIVYDCLSVVAELAELKLCTNRKTTEAEKAAEKAKQKTTKSRARTEMQQKWNR